MPVLPTLNEPNCNPLSHPSKSPARRSTALSSPQHQATGVGQLQLLAAGLVFWSQQ